MHTSKRLATEKIGDGTSYIKINNIAQFFKGKVSAIVYYASGRFMLRSFELGKESKEVTLNELLGIDDQTLCYQSIDDPFISCCFTDETTVFIGLYHGSTMTHYHFLVDINTMSLVGEATMVSFENSSPSNYIIRVFFNPAD